MGKINIVYWSQSGNTAEMAEALAAALLLAGHRHGGIV